MERHRCDDCGQEYSEETLEAEGKLGLHVIDRLTERIDPGCIVPSGECIACGALVYPVESRFVPKAFEGRLKKLVEIYRFDKRMRFIIEHEGSVLEDVVKEAEELLKTYT